MSSGKGTGRRTKKSKGIIQYISRDIVSSLERCRIEVSSNEYLLLFFALACSTVLYFCQSQYQYPTNQPCSWSIGLGVGLFIVFYLLILYTVSTEITLLSTQGIPQWIGEEGGLLCFYFIWPGKQMAVGLWAKLYYHIYLNSQLLLFIDCVMQSCYQLKEDLTKASRCEAGLEWNAMERVDLRSW